MKALILCPFHEESLKDLSVMMPTAYESWTDTQKLYDPYDLANRICIDNISIVIISDKDISLRQSQKSVYCQLNFGPSGFHVLCKGHLFDKIEE